MDGRTSATIHISVRPRSLKTRTKTFTSRPSSSVRFHSRFFSPPFSSSRSAALTTAASTMPNATASSAVMYVSRSNAASTSFAPFPVCFCMMALSDPRVRSALDALMMMSVVCPLMT